MSRREFVATARSAGWHVVGHNWLRLTQGSARIEVLFVDGRAVGANYRTPEGLRSLNVSQLRDPDLRHDLAGLIAADLVDRARTGTPTFLDSPSRYLY